MALSRVIPAHERIVTIEDARELQIAQPNWVAMETVEPYDTESTAVTIGDLVRNALRQCPDRIVVGEVRGEEAFYLLRALSTGHGGGFGTIHANDGMDALHQLQILAQMAPIAGLTAPVIAAMIMRAVDVVVYQSVFESDNTRRVSEVLEVERSVADGSSGTFGVRRLVVWDDVAKRWTLPQPPSPRLAEVIARQGLAWPEEVARA